MKLATLFKASNVLVAAAMATALTCTGAQARYLDRLHFDFIHILAPPPAPQSPAGQADIAAVLSVQAARTDADVTAAQADDETSVLRFADVMGSGFKSENLPFAAAFFNDVGLEANQRSAPPRVISIDRARSSRTRG
jgi:hypothetical protein